jgi:pimeloyl-ACP methyl ester carboxylesterase
MKIVFLIIAVSFLAISGCSNMNTSSANRSQSVNDFSTPQVKMVATKGATLFSQAFGDPNDKPILLMMGAMTSGIWWPDDFCKMLSHHGYYVIRYDNRDTGESTHFELGNAGYVVEDLADDAVAVLDAYGINRANLVGMSLGGYLSQIVALKYPRRVLTLTLIASERLALADPTMPGISPAIVEYHSKAGVMDWSDKATVVNYQVGAWRLLTGPKRSFDADHIAHIATKDFDRTQSPMSAFNHANLGDAVGWVGRLNEIAAPTLIIHGTHDPVLPYAHALALRSEIAGSSLLTLEGAGHELNREDWGVMINAIYAHTKNEQ